MKLNNFDYIENIDFVHYGPLNDYFVKACRVGDLDEVRRINSKFKPKLKSNNKFIRIAQNILTKIKEDYTYVDVHYYDDRCFRYACDSGNLEIVKYLLTSDELIEKCDINSENDYGLRIACENGDLNLAQYLLTSSDLNKHANIHANNDGVIKSAYDSGNSELINFLIFDMNIEKTTEIIKFIEEYAPGLNQLFDKRELHKYLLTEIVPKKVQKSNKHKL